MKPSRWMDVNTHTHTHIHTHTHVRTQVFGGKPFEAGDSLRKDTRDIDQIRLHLCLTKTVCNFQSMKTHVELNSLLSKFFCYITWFAKSPD